MHGDAGTELTVLVPCRRGGVTPLHAWQGGVREDHIAHLATGANGLTHPVVGDLGSSSVASGYSGREVRRAVRSVEVFDIKFASDTVAGDGKTAALASAELD